MLLKVYGASWAVFSLFAAVFFVTGNLTMFTGVVFGFVAMTLTFMGIIAVLPSTVAHPSAPKPAKLEVAPEPARREVMAAKPLGILKSA